MKLEIHVLKLCGLAEWLGNHLVGADGTCPDDRRTLQRPFSETKGVRYYGPSSELQVQRNSAVFLATVYSCVPSTTTGYGAMAYAVHYRISFIAIE